MNVFLKPVSVPVVIAALACVAGCTASVAGTPSPSPSPRPRSSPAGPPPGVPRVAIPLDTTAFRRAPCTMLTPAQQAEFKIRAPGVVRGDPLGLVCGWDDGRGPSGMTLTLGFVSSGHGLSGSYINHSLGVIPGFREMPPIRGYPTVIANVNVDDEAEGMCNFAVGTTDEEVVTIIVQITGDEVRQPDQHNPCPRAQRVAEATMGNMVTR